MSIRQKIYGIGLCLMGLLFNVNSLPAAEITLAEEGRTRFTIVKSVEATPPESLAVSELVNHLQKSTGVTFPVVTDDVEIGTPRIIVGPGRLSRSILGRETVDGLKTDEFMVRTVGRDILLVGDRPRGTLYAVYSFLEKEVGFRWFNRYGDKFVPRHTALRVKAPNREESPAFINRDMHFVNFALCRIEAAKFFVRNRMTGPQIRRWWFHEPKFGGSHYGFAQGIEHRYLRHTLFRYINPDEYFQKHPEFFSLIGGRRVKHQHLCFSNLGLRQTLTAKVKENIGRFEGRGVFAVSLADRAGDLCQCPGCQALIEREGTPGAPLLDFLVELAQSIKDEYPQAYISTLAYRWCQTEIPPRYLRMPDNVIIILAPIENNFAAPFEDETNARTLQNIKGWAERTENLWVWYYTNPFPRQGALPIGNLRKMAQDFRFFRRIGVEGFFNEHGGGVAELHLLADLQTWLLGKLMWNPDQDLDLLIKDFTDHFYGPAAPYLRKYIKLLEEATEAMDTGMTWNASSYQYRFLTAEFLISLQTLFDRAEQSVAKDPVLLLRVRQARMTPDRASILFWDRLSAIPDMELVKADIAERYRAIMRKLVEKRIAPQHRQRVLPYVEDFLDIRLMMTPLKPLPAPLDRIPEERIRQITPDFFTRPHIFSFDRAEIKTDPQAATGITVTKLTGGELPLTLGFYCVHTRRFLLTTEITKGEIISPLYNLYKIGRASLSENCYIWFTRSWLIQVPVGEHFDSRYPEREWDIWASLRFEGPTYPFGEKGNEDRVFVDRIILVEVEE